MKLQGCLIACLMLYAASASCEKTYPLATLEWPPYTSKNISDHGYATKLVTRAFELGGANASYTFMPWSRAVLSAQSAQSVAIYPEYYNENLTDQFVFSDGFPGGRIGLFALKEGQYPFNSLPPQNQESALKALDQYTFGVVQGYTNTKIFDEANFLRKIRANSDRSNLEMLKRKRVDLIVIDELVSDYLIKTYLPSMQETTEMLEPPLEYKQLHVGFSKEHPDHLEAMEVFNKGLKSLKESGELQAILNEFNIPAPPN